MNLLFQRLKKRRPSGQIVVMLVVLLAVILIFVSVVINLGIISQMKALISIASDSAAISMASAAGSYADFLRTRALDNKSYECKWATATWIFILNIVLLLLSIVLACFWPPAGFAVYVLIASLLLQLYTMIKNSENFRKSLAKAQDQFNKMTADLTDQQKFPEIAVQSAMTLVISDPVMVPDEGDINMNLLTDFDGDTVPRYAALLKQRLDYFLDSTSRVPMEEQAIEDFLPVWRNEFACQLRHGPVWFDSYSTVTCGSNEGNLWTCALDQNVDCPVRYYIGKDGGNGNDSTRLYRLFYNMRDWGYPWPACDNSGVDCFWQPEFQACNFDYVGWDVSHKCSDIGFWQYCATETVDNDYHHLDDPEDSTPPCYNYSSDPNVFPPNDGDACVTYYEMCPVKTWYCSPYSTQYLDDCYDFTFGGTLPPGNDEIDNFIKSMEHFFDFSIEYLSNDWTKPEAPDLVETFSTWFNKIYSKDCRSCWYWIIKEVWPPILTQLDNTLDSMQQWIITDKCSGVEADCQNLCVSGNAAPCTAPDTTWKQQLDRVANYRTRIVTNILNRIDIFLQAVEAVAGIRDGLNPNVQGPGKMTYSWHDDQGWHHVYATVEQACPYPSLLTCKEDSFWPWWEVCNYLAPMYGGIRGGGAGKVTVVRYDEDRGLVSLLTGKRLWRFILSLGRSPFSGSIGLEGRSCDYITNDRQAGINCFGDNPTLNSPLSDGIATVSCAEWGPNLGDIRFIPCSQYGTKVCDATPRPGGDCTD